MLTIVTVRWSSGLYCPGYRHRHSRSQCNIYVRKPVVIRVSTSGCALLFNTHRTWHKTSKTFQHTSIVGLFCRPSVEAIRQACLPSVNPLHICLYIFHVPHSQGLRKPAFSTPERYTLRCSFNACTNQQCAPQVCLVCYWRFYKTVNSALLSVFLKLRFLQYELLITWIRFPNHKSDALSHTGSSSTPLSTKKQCHSR